MWKAAQAQGQPQMSVGPPVGATMVATMSSSTAQVAEIDFSLLGGAQSTASSKVGHPTPSVLPVPLVHVVASTGVAGVGLNTLASNPPPPPPNIFETDPFRNL